MCSKVATNVNWSVLSMEHKTIIAGSLAFLTSTAMVIRLIDEEGVPLYVCYFFLVSLYLFWFVVLSYDSVWLHLVPSYNNII